MQSWEGDSEVKMGLLAGIEPRMGTMACAGALVPMAMATAHAQLRMRMEARSSRQINFECNRQPHKQAAVRTPRPGAGADPAHAHVRANLQRPRLPTEGGPGPSETAAGRGLAVLLRTCVPRPRRAREGAGGGH